MNKEEFFKGNLKKLEKDIKIGEMIIFFSGMEICFSCDTTYRFRVNKNFYYYTGIEVDNAYFLAFKTNEKVIKKFFYDFADEKLVKWIGRKLTITEIEEKLDLKPDMIYPKANLLAEIKKLFKNNKVEKIYKDANVFGSEVNQILYEELGLKENNKTVKYESIDKFAALHRPYKEDYEIEQMREAIKLTEGAIRTVMKNITNCKYEYEAEAYYDFYLKKKNVRNKAFESIFASGDNGVTLHYVDNNSNLSKKQLLLMDVGAEYMNYAADISRTIPVGGKFNEVQKKFYNIVLTTNKLVIEHIRAGITFKELNDYAKQILTDELIKIGLITNPVDVDEYYYHSVSHPLGLDAHDLRGENAIISNGMVITVEPGLYIKEHGIGIRIEDDIYVTEDKNIVLTENVPKEIIDIENCMKMMN